MALNEDAASWVASWCDGALAPRRGVGYHVRSPAHGRIRVAARNRQSASLLWFHVPEVAEDAYDAVVLCEFESPSEVAAAWFLTPDEVDRAATSSTVRKGRKILKVPVAGSWTRWAKRIP